jgi:hypothetical protein
MCSIISASSDTSPTPRTMAVDCASVEQVAIGSVRAGPSVTEPTAASPERPLRQRAGAQALADSWAGTVLATSSIVVMALYAAVVGGLAVWSFRWE